MKLIQQQLMKNRAAAYFSQSDFSFYSMNCTVRDWKMLPNYVLWTKALCFTVHKLIPLYMKYACQCAVVIKAAFEARNCKY